MDGLSKPAVAEAPVAVPVMPTAATRETATTGNKVETDLYMTYQLDHNVPFVADYYGIANMMEFSDISYKAEIDSIDGYISDEVKGERLQNSTEAVKGELRKLERLAGIEKHVPTASRVKQLAAYADFLRKANNIKRGIV